MTEETEIKRENLLNMRSINEVMTKKPTEIYGEILKKAFTHDWIFGLWYEKLIVSGSFLWACWSLGSWIWRLF